MMQSNSPNTHPKRASRDHPSTPRGSRGSLAEQQCLSGINSQEVKYPWHREIGMQFPTGESANSYLSPNSAGARVRARHSVGTASHLRLCPRGHPFKARSPVPVLSRHQSIEVTDERCSECSKLNERRSPVIRHPAYAPRQNLMRLYGPCDVLDSPPMSPKEFDTQLLQSGSSADHGSRIMPPPWLWFSFDVLTEEPNGDAGENSDDDSVMTDEDLSSDRSSTDLTPSQKSRRLGRRPAIIEDKENPLGAVEVADVSPYNSCDEAESVASNDSEISKDKTPNSHAPTKKAASGKIDPSKRILLKRRTIHDFAQHNAYKSVFEETGVDTKDKKGKSSFLHKLTGHKMKDTLVSPEILESLKRVDFTENCNQYLSEYKTSHWTKLLKNMSPGDLETLPNHERKRREAVWELFQSECTFLLDHLVVLKNCFRQPLREAIVDGHFANTDPEILFGNLDELFYVSSSFCKDLIHRLLTEAKSHQFGQTTVVVKALEKLSENSRNGEVYHIYCLNYSKAITYLDYLRAHLRFADFEKWCQRDSRCHRLTLTDLLISPMQHCTKLPLLLNNIRKYTTEQAEKEMLSEAINKFENSLKSLEVKMQWLKNYERVRELQSQVQWLPVSELDPKAYIPEFLKPRLGSQPCERLLANPKRQLLHEGPLTLLEISKALEVFLLLFDDILLITKIKKTPRKKLDPERTMAGPLPTGSTEGAVFIVYKQPLALDRFTMYDLDKEQSGSGIKNTLVLVHFNRFQHVTGIFSLQAASEGVKRTWLSQLSKAQEDAKTSRRRFPRGDSEIVLDAEDDCPVADSKSLCTCGRPLEFLPSSKSRPHGQASKPDEQPSQSQNSTTDIIIVDDVLATTRDGKVRLLQSLDLPDKDSDLMNTSEGSDGTPHIALSSVIYTTDTASCNSNSSHSISPAFQDTPSDDNGGSGSVDSVRHLVSPIKNSPLLPANSHARSLLASHRLKVKPPPGKGDGEDEKGRSGSFSSRLSVRQAGLAAIKEKSQSLDIVYV